METWYLQKLLDVYQEKWGCDPAAVGQVRAHPKAGPHLQHQREAFYCAEQLRVFARDSVPEGTFESLQKNVHDGVVSYRYTAAYRRSDTGSLAESMTIAVKDIRGTCAVDLGGVDREKLARCIEECIVCAQACTACSDSCRLRRHLHRNPVPPLCRRWRTPEGSRG